MHIAISNNIAHFESTAINLLNQLYLHRLVLVNEDQSPIAARMRVVDGRQ